MDFRPKRESISLKEMAPAKSGWCVRQRRYRPLMKLSSDSKVPMKVSSAIVYGFIPSYALDSYSSPDQIIFVRVSKTLPSTVISEDGTISHGMNDYPSLVPSADLQEKFTTTKRDQQDVPYELALMQRTSSAFLDSWPSHINFSKGKPMSLYDLYREMINFQSSFHQSYDYLLISPNSVVAVFILDEPKDTTDNNIRVRKFYPRTSLDMKDLDNTINMSVFDIDLNKEVNLYIPSSIKKQGFIQYFCLFLPSNISS